MIAVLFLSAFAADLYEDEFIKIESCDTEARPGHTPCTAAQPNRIFDIGPEGAPAMVHPQRFQYFEKEDGERLVLELKNPGQMNVIDIYTEPDSLSIELEGNIVDVSVNLDFREIKWTFRGADILVTHFEEIKVTRR